MNFSEEVNKAGEEATLDEWLSFSDKYSEHLGALLRVTALMTMAASDDKTLNMRPDIEEKVIEKWGHECAPGLIVDFGTVFLAMAQAVAEETNRDPGVVFAEVIEIAEKAAQKFVQEQAVQLAAKKLIKDL